jgi:hypothetical protein
MLRRRRLGYGAGNSCRWGHNCLQAHRHFPANRNRELRSQLTGLLITILGRLSQSLENNCFYRFRHI